MSRAKASGAFVRCPECQQLAFYQERFTLFLQQAQEHARPQLELSHKLGFAAGLAAAIFCL